jgi:hypothetical protein
MRYNFDSIRSELVQVISLAGGNIRNDQIEIDNKNPPHKPEGLRRHSMGVYMFEFNGIFLKIGKANSNSNARFLSQHYNINSSNSNLAKSIFNDNDFEKYNINENAIGEWIKNNIRRIDIFLDESLGMFVLNLVEAYLQLKFLPKYEGYENQRKR